MKPLVSTSVLHLAVPDERGGYHVQPLDVPFQGMMVDPCLSHDGRTLLFAWKGPTGSGDLDLWQMRRVPKHEVVTTSQPALATVETPFANSLGMRFVPVPITGGDTDRQRVLFSVWETRVQDYAVFVTHTGRRWTKPDFEQGPTHPAVHLSWDDAQAFCRWLTARERKAGTISENEHYRLPLDREWSCAVGIAELEPPTASPFGKHGGLPDAFTWGREWPPPADAGNFRGEECQQPSGTASGNPIAVIKGRRDPFVHTAPVGSFPPGPCGLLDLSGNVREWCEEWYNPSRNDIRVLRGGDYTLNDGGMATAASRFAFPPEMGDAATGVRIVLGQGAGPDVKAWTEPVPPVPAPIAAVVKPAPSPPSYPWSATWTDLTESFTKQVLAGSRGKVEDGLVHITKPGFVPLDNSRIHGDVALRVVFQGCLKASVRRASPVSYTASVESLPASGERRAALFQYDDALKTTTGFGSMNATLDARFDLTVDHELVISAIGEQMGYWLDGRLVHTAQSDAAARGFLSLSFQNPPVFSDVIARVRKVEYAEMPSPVKK